MGSLFSSRAAIAELDSCRRTLQGKLLQRQQNGLALTRAIEGLGWRVLTNSDFASGVILMRATDEATRRIAPAQVRSFFLTHRISVTAYEQGLLRLSMPDRPWRRGQLDLLTWTLKSYVRNNDRQVSADRAEECVVA